jgi:hypothetical protein
MPDQVFGLLNGMQDGDFVLVFIARASLYDSVRTWHVST